MNKEALVGPLFSVIDDKDVSVFLSYMSKDCIFRFGNLPMVNGIEAVGEFVGAFFESIASLKHELTDSWDVSNGVVCHGQVTYTRHDKSVLSVPFSNILKMKDGKISEYLIFADTSQLYGP